MHINKNMKIVITKKQWYISKNVCIVGTKHKIKKRFKTYRCLMR